MKVYLTFCPVLELQGVFVDFSQAKLFAESLCGNEEEAREGYIEEWDPLENLCLREVWRKTEFGVLNVFEKE